MSFTEWLAHPSARLLTLALAHFVWQGLAVACLLVALVQLCRVRRAPARYACSLAALVAMVACLPVTFIWLATHADVADPASTSIHASAPAELASAHSWFEPLALRASIQAAQPYLLAAWVVGVVLFGGRLLIGAIGIARLRRSRLPLTEKVAATVGKLGRRLQMKARPLVYLSQQVAEAMAIGVIRPFVLLPAAWASEMPPDMLEAVIAHELAHLRRRDLWVNLLQRLAETVLFYHPAVWWLSRRLRIERELCADEIAVAATENRLAYAQALEQVALQQQADIRPALAAFLRGEKDMRLLQRVQNVLRPKKDDRSRLWPAGLVALALPVGLWLASAGIDVATAQDERERDRPVREREIERRVEIQRDGDRPRKVVARDGDAPRKPGPRDGEAARKPGPRDEGEGFKPKFTDLDVVERKVTAKEAGSEARRLEELTLLVKRLSAQVERLQDEVSSLRDRSGPRDEAVRSLKESYERKKVDDDEAAAREKLYRLRSEVEKDIADKVKIAAQRQRAEAEKAAVAAHEQAEQAKLETAKINDLIKLRQVEAKRQAEEAVRKNLELLKRGKVELPDDLPEEDLIRLKKKLLEDQSLLLDRAKEQVKEALKEKLLKEKPELKEQPTLKRKPLKENPDEQ